jgi:hypothetical protein
MRSLQSSLCHWWARSILPRLRPRHPARERGSVSIWIATSGLVMIILVGLAVDLGGQVHAQQHARDVAAQAVPRGSGDRSASGSPPPDSS